MKARNLVLIGMPASGKSTLGVLTAKALGWDFLDSDVLIQVQQGCTLRTLIQSRGMTAFRAVEAQTLASLNVDRCVIATGGSAVFSRVAMAHLRALGWVAWLRVSLEELTKRVGDLDERGVLHAPGETLADIYRRRQPLYRRYAHAIVDCDGKSPERIVSELVGLAR